MIPDFKNLLTAFLSKDGAGVLGVVGKKMSRSTTPLPSEAMVTQMGEGAHQAARENTPQALPEHQTVVKTNTPWAQTNVGKGAMGALGNVSNMLNQMVNQPMQTGNALMDTGYEAQDAIARYLPKYAQGGVIRRGQAGVVGDGGDHPEAKEVVTVLPDGSGAVVTPMAHQLQQPQPEAYGLEQDEPVNVVNINDTNPVLPADEVAANQMRDRVNEAMVVGQNKWKDIGYGALQGVANALAGTNNPIKTYGEVKRDRRVRQLAPQLQVLEDKVKDRRASERATVEAENIRFDNKLAKEKFDALQTAKADAAKGQALNKVVGLKWIDPKNTTHIALLERAGIDPTTVEGYDDRKRDMKQVAGIWYRDNGKGVFEQTNIPLDESKSLVDYKVAMPTGEIRTFKVANKDAANFATQMHALGLRLEQQQQQFERRQALDEKQFGLAQAKFEQTKKEYDEALARGDKKTATDKQMELADKIQKATTAYNTGELNDTQYRILMDAYSKIGQQ